MALFGAVFIGLATFPASDGLAQCQDYWTAEYKCAQGCGPCGNSAPVYTAPARDYAAEAAQQARQQRLNEAYNANERGVAFANKGDWAKAIFWYKAALAKNPDSQIMRQNLVRAQTCLANEKGLASSREGHYANAAAFFQEAINKNPSKKDLAVLKANLAQAQSNLRTQQIQRAEAETQRAEAETQRAKAEKDRQLAEQRDKAAADKMQQIVQTFSQTITPAQSSDGPDSNGRTGGNPPSSGDLDFLPGNSTVTQPASPANHPLEFGDPSTGDAFGTRKSNQIFTTAEAPKPGSNTKAVDQLKSAEAQAARGSDLTINYDVGRGPSAGTITAHTLSAGPPPMDLSHFSARAKKDPEIVGSLNSLSELQSKRIKLESERTQLTKERNVADPASMSERTACLEQKDKEYQANLVDITKKTEEIEKLRRRIDNTVEETPANAPDDSIAEPPAKASDDAAKTGTNK